MVLVLAVKRDEVAPELSQLTRTGLPAVNSRGAPFAELTPQDEGRAAGFEDPFDRGALGAVPDLVGATPRAKRQAQRVDDQRLAAAGLAGEEVETGSKSDARLCDQRQVADLQLFEH
jgi:hypothetical protein